MQARRHWTEQSKRLGARSSSPVPLAWHQGTRTPATCARTLRRGGACAKRDSCCLGSVEAVGNRNLALSGVNHMRLGLLRSKPELSVQAGRTIAARGGDRSAARRIEKRKAREGGLGRWQARALASVISPDSLRSAPAPSGFRRSSRRQPIRQGCTRGLCKLGRGLLTEPRRPARVNLGRGRGRFRALSCLPDPRPAPADQRRADGILAFRCILLAPAHPQHGCRCLLVLARGTDAPPPAQPGASQGLGAAGLASGSQRPGTWEPLRSTPSRTTSRCVDSWFSLHWLELEGAQSPGPRAGGCCST